MNDPQKSFRARAKSWADKNKLHGVQAFFRFVVFTYLECLTKESDEFVLKGGNLLWMYIKTPRHTIDLDLITKNVMTAAKLRILLETAGKHTSGIRFLVKSIKEISQENVKAAAVVIQYETDEGATNTFDIDIVYALPTDLGSLTSPISQKLNLIAATIENIIADKLSASHRFGSGNTRMKDFDDLWRIAQSDTKINWQKLNRILNDRQIPKNLQKSWISIDMLSYWAKHAKRYKDLPKELSALFDNVNIWLDQEH